VLVESCVVGEELGSAVKSELIYLGSPYIEEWNIQQDGAVWL
jgi:hypothetical protein